MQLAPGEKFAIVRQLSDPNDSGTYYVQALVRDAHTDELLETVNLTDRGSQRFSALWNVYSKRSNGFYISITTTVYTDSGYTTLSDAYARESETYLIERRDYHAGGGGSGISAQKVRQIVEEVVTGLLGTHTKAIDERLGALDKSGTEPVYPYDDAVLLQAISALTAVVKGLEVKPNITVTPTKVEIGAPVVDTKPIAEAVVSAVESKNKEFKAELKSTADALASIHEAATSFAEAAKSLTQIGKILGILEAATGDKKDDQSVPSPYELIRGFRNKK